MYWYFVSIKYTLYKKKCEYFRVASITSNVKHAYLKQRYALSNCLFSYCLSKSENVNYITPCYFFHVEKIDRLKISFAIYPISNIILNFETKVKNVLLLNF